MAQTKAKTKTKAKEIRTRGGKVITNEASALGKQLTGKAAGTAKTGKAQPKAAKPAPQPSNVAQMPARGTGRKGDRKGMAGGGPVGVPVGVPAAQASETATPVETDGTYRDYPLLADLPSLVARQQELKRRIASVDPLIKEESEVREEIETLLMAAGVTDGAEGGVTCGGFKVLRVVKQPTRKLQKHLLLEQGVSADIIEACIVPVGEGSSYALVSAIKDKDEAQTSTQTDERSAS